jgi:hypothetical protein
MRKKSVFIFGAFVLAFSFFTACNQSPFKATRDASGGGINKFGVASSLVVFNNELTTGGGAFEYPSGDNQVLTFNDTSNPISRRSIRYMWTGGDVLAPGCNPNPEHSFAGFDLMYTPLISNYSISSNSPGRDLSKAGYSKVTFYARGSLSSSTILKIEVAAQGVAAGCPVPPHVSCVTLSNSGIADDPNYPCGATAKFGSSWQPYTIPIIPGALTNVKDFFKATFIFTPVPGFTAPGQGGIAYFDMIQYAP